MIFTFPSVCYLSVHLPTDLHVSMLMVAIIDEPAGNGIGWTWWCLLRMTSEVVEGLPSLPAVVAKVDGSCH